MTDYLNALAMRTKAAEACDAQSAVFASTEYAIGQPLSSFSERFACGEVKSAILALPIEADHAALLAEAVKVPEIAALIEIAKLLRIFTGNYSGKSVNKLNSKFDAALLALDAP